MSQHDFNIANQGFPATRSDINNALAALASTSSGTSEPSTTYANQFWYDTTNNLLKFRNEADSAWITLAYLDQGTNEWEIRSAVIQAVDSAGVVIKTDDGTARVTVADDGDVTFANDVVVSSGDLLVGQTSLNYNAIGGSISAGGTLRACSNSFHAASFNRKTSDGDIAIFYKDGSTAGSIGALSSALTIGSGDTGLFFQPAYDRILPLTITGNTGRDAAIDLGASTTRFKDLYLSGGVYLGGTGSANKLDDYEEGTWTPNFYDGTNTVSFTNGATYVKIGKVVHIAFATYNANFSSLTGSYVQITGLPFTISGEQAVPIMCDTNDDTKTTWYWLATGTSHGFLKESRFADALTGSEFEDNNDVYFSATYKSQ